MKEACALLINDIHVSKDNISEFQLNWDEALSVCDEYKIPEIVIGGDLWQSRSSQTLSTLIAVRNALIKAHNHEIYVTIAEGNHDLVDQEALIGYSHIFSQYPDITVVDDYSVISYGDKVDFYVMSYFPESGGFMEVFHRLKKEVNPDMFNILYLHEGINGALAHSSDKELPADIFADFDSVLVGHYHNRCKILNTNVEYIGSSRQHNFGEDEEKGYTILFTDGSTKFIKNEVNTRYAVVDIELSDMSDEDMDNIADIKSDSRYKVKAKISCNSKEVATIDKQKLLDLGVSKIEVITEELEATQTASSSNLDSKFDKNGIKSEYKNFCVDKNITDVELGIKYLDKIN